MTVETTLVPAGAYARAISGATGTGPSAVTSVPGARRSGTASVAKVVPLIPARRKMAPHGVLPSQCPSQVSITRPSTHQPTFVYDQKLARTAARGDIGHEPRERAVVLVVSAVEAELQPGAQRKPGTIRKKVAQCRAFGPAACAQLRHVRGHRIIQRQPACFRETSDHRRDHRLGQRARR